MSKEEKHLLLQELCARLPYEVIVKFEVDTSYDTVYDSIFQTSYFDGELLSINVDSGEVELLIKSDNEDLLVYLDEQLKAQPVVYEECKPYLRPMSSMTEEEKKEYENCYQSDDTTTATLFVDFYNRKHFDYRGLIEKGLALEAPKGMYNLKEK